MTESSNEKQVFLYLHFSRWKLIPRVDVGYFDWEEFQKNRLSPEEVQFLKTKHEEYVGHFQLQWVAHARWIGIMYVLMLITFVSLFIILLYALNIFSGNRIDTSGGFYIYFILGELGLFIIFYYNYLCLVQFFTYYINTKLLYLLPYWNREMVIGTPTHPFQFFSYIHRHDLFSFLELFYRYIFIHHNTLALRITYRESLLEIPLETYRDSQLETITLI